MVLVGPTGLLVVLKVVVVLVVLVVLFSSVFFVLLTELLVPVGLLVWFLCLSSWWCCSFDGIGKDVGVDILVGLVGLLLLVVLVM